MCHSTTASRYLTSMRHSTAPTILGIRGSLRCVALLLMPWESQLTSALFTQVGAAIGTGPPSGAPPIKLSASTQCKHSSTKRDTRAYAK
ncbi:hypothetical protein M405DRAFT_829670, partial [Rhizopogon salebrosus TDB-379]